MRLLSLLSLCVYLTLVIPSHASTLSLLQRYLRTLLDSPSLTPEVQSAHVTTRGSNSNRHVCRNNEHDTITATSGVLMTPLRDGLYPNDLECGWTVSVNPGKVIELKWVYFDVEDETDCDYDALQVFDGPAATSASHVKTHCGSTAPPTFVSTSNHVTLTFSSDESVQQKGVKLRFAEKDAPKQEPSVVEPECNGHLTLTTTEGDLFSPGYSQKKLTPNCEAAWFIKVPHRTVRLHFTSFSLMEEEDCWTDQLTVFDGDDFSGKVLGQYCGSSIPPDVVSSTGSLAIRLLTSDDSVHAGFHAHYTTEGGPTPTTTTTTTTTTPAPTPGPCGTHSDLEGQSGTIEFPGNAMDTYPDDCIRSWSIHVPNGVVKLHFDYMGIEADSSCDYDYLRVLDGSSSTSSQLQRLCGTSVPADVVATGSHVYLKFFSDDSVNLSGFKLTYSACTTCGGDTQPITPGPCGTHSDLEGQSGTIEFPGNAMDTYPDNCIRSWSIHVPNGVVKLHFDYMGIEPDSSCAYDYLRVLDGSSSTSSQLQRLCGTSVPADVVATGSHVYLKFSSDDSVNLSGFKLTYSACTTCGGDTQPTTPASNDTPTSAGLDCTFESSTCGWTQTAGDDFDWVRHQGGTITEDTGPEHDHSTSSSTGHYMYIESSSPRTAGNKAGLQSPLMEAGAARCVHFFYFMYGRGVGTLRVLLRRQGVADIVLWERSGDQGQRWNMARVSSETTANYRIVFEGTTTGSIWGDIAIDDVRVTHEACAPIGAHCGRSLYTRRVKRVVGGQEALLHQFPWAVHMRTFNADGSAYVRCGGSLIDRRWVLTAAHCMEIGDTRITDPSKVKLFMGEHDVEEDEEFDYQYTADRIIVHPQRSKFGPGPFDLTLVRLTEPVELSDSVNVVCLPSTSDSYPTGTPCTASGWGLTGTGNLNSEVLLYVNMTVADKSRCLSIFGSDLVGDDVICAGHDSLEKTSCRGDSGGPLVTKQGNQYSLIGVVSWGAPCGRTPGGIPSGYASVQYFLDWIETSIANNS